MWKSLQASFSPKKTYFSTPDYSVPSEVKERKHGQKQNFCLYPEILRMWLGQTPEWSTHHPQIYGRGYSISAKKHQYLAQLQRVSEGRSLLGLQEQKYLKNLSKWLEKKPVNYHGFTLTVLESILCLHRWEIEGVWLY